jgi:hypothetical protein
MLHPFLSILMVGLLAASAVHAQEVLPPEERDTIEPEAEPAAKGTDKKTVSKEHTVTSGDTLWDLCGSYLNNPWYWPRVWSYNPEISNPHWIFPGQVVRFYPGGEGPAELDIVSRDMDIPVPEDISIEDESIPAEDLVSMTGSIRGAKTVSAVKILRNAFVTRKELDEMGTIRASREEVEFLHELNTIYIDFQDLSAVSVGQQFVIYRTEAEISHPVTGEFVGYYTKVLGACQITNIAESSAVAQIVTSSEPMGRGDRVGPMMPKLTTEVGPSPNQVELRGYILGAAVTQLSFLGEHHLVFLDQGTEQGVRDGNVFDVIRREDGLFMPGEGKEEGKWDKSMPAEIYGRIMVVDARENASTGLVVASLRELRVGDRVMMSLK